MRASKHNVDLSASDLGGFLACRHKTALDLAVAKGLRKAPPVYEDPVMEVLKQRGFEHEQNFAEESRKNGQTVVDLSDGDGRVERTVAAMKNGADLILQGKLEHDGWFGYPDILRRTETPADGLGGWSYEIVDTKLARETRGTTILQLALYSELLSLVQGAFPECFYVVTPEREEAYRFADYAAYYRLVKQRLAATVRQHPDKVAAAHYPEPVEHCELCRWRMECDRKRRADDHLSLVAGISRLQTRELEGHDVTTLAALGTLALPLPFDPDRGAIGSYVRVREQARVQLEGRTKKRNVHELLLPIEETEGLTRLPEPSPSDIFLDLEGDPFARDDGGREYLFGLVTVGPRGKQTYHRYWAYTDAGERDAFEKAIDQIMAAWERDASMHVYHYGAYEPSAMKRLMGRHATREAEVDRLLRGERFVDLHTIVKQSLRASVERYSIKDMEKFFGFEREVDLRTAGTHRGVVERALELDTPELITSEDRKIVEIYNRDDCVSALLLRDWLDKLRASLVNDGTDVPRPAPQDGEPSEELTDYQRRIRALVETLTKGVPVERSERTAEQHARWLLANLLEYHRREDKAAWWEFFRLQDLPVEDYIEEPQAIMGLKFTKRLHPGARGAPTDRYTYPHQDCHVGDGAALHDANGELGDVVEQDRAARTIDVKKRVARADDHPTAVFAHKIVRARPLPSAIERIAQAVVDGGLKDAGSFRAAWSLLLNEPPRLRKSAFKQRNDESAVEFAVRVGTKLDGTVLPIQGPPGSGKTFTGARMICELVKNGMRVGVSGPSHAVIDNLLQTVVAEARAARIGLTCGAKVNETREKPGAIQEFTDNKASYAALRAGAIHVLGGTAWLWAAEEALDLVDVLVIDEAGQMSLTNTVAASGAAESIVLLGDPQQLEQVQQGSHPEGTDVSALEHILGGQRTIPDDRGIFLPETWRMHPSICAFCSDVFYEGRLRSHAGLEKQSLAGVAPFDGAGLWVVGVAHDGNQSDSPEEVNAVERIVQKLLGKKAQWTDADGKSRPMTPSDVLVVAPYNRQVGELHERMLTYGVRVGTVDKFQGRQAPVVIYSMTTSSPEDAPRGLEFLYNLSRLNVATSRARCATILVASPKLFEPECRTPRQMKLANALCRYVEMATIL